MTGRLGAVIKAAQPPGVYLWRSRAHHRAVRRELTAAGWAAYPLDGFRITDATRSHEECARILAFPAWFGHNWDTLADCLSDLSWLRGRGHVLIWDRYGVLAHADAGAWRRAYEVFQAAIASRAGTNMAPLYLLLRGLGPVRSPVSGGPIPVLDTDPGTGHPARCWTPGPILDTPILDT
jgi:hypothetical protein